MSLSHWGDSCSVTREVEAGAHRGFTLTAGGQQANHGPARLGKIVVQRLEPETSEFGGLEWPLRNNLVQISDITEVDNSARPIFVERWL